MQHSSAHPHCATSAAHGTHRTMLPSLTAAPTHLWGLKPLKQHRTARETCDTDGQARTAPCPTHNNTLSGKEQAQPSKGAALPQQSCNHTVSLPTAGLTADPAPHSPSCPTEHGAPAAAAHGVLSVLLVHLHQSRHAPQAVGVTRQAFQCCHPTRILLRPQTGSQPRCASSKRKLCSDSALIEACTTLPGTPQ